MKAWVISDLHASRLDLLHPRPLIIPEADICIYPGDVTDDIKRSIDYLKSEIAPHMPVVATLGNHDYYGSSIDGTLEYARNATIGTNVHVLENGVFQKDGVRVIGATLWTDFEIDAHSEGHLPLSARRDLAIRECTRRMMDFYQIVLPQRREDGGLHLISADDLLERHLASRAYIQSQLEVPFDGTTVVLTHHAPSPRSLSPQFIGHITNAAFASDLRELIHTWRPQFWIHGHIHHFSDYLEGDTRVLCNPRGYHREVDVVGFRPGLVIDLSSQAIKGFDDE
ncbi:metallophosphoesterase [Aliirhizobium cellulosilyticum]|uniref:Icc-related predicted phosphoesterase n=1 Tax=Aliirhizobium cellulosilyticum TaxID=393664 RepID=A0A7W6V158_9HYPH|nr:metallophosphoesterase [Rhizobium cellulosilyticum]MBB4349437.1 Icc-related predicted phosphoesterase [Rhizobium cellulosilyticum]MBB4412341.1 Icc-related predicted phosphoesterase [Rhizobium cellulosilyticum]MBB4446972.1 Icc-related predicted phosphoesterase [Rhizobium cellulosilyticum]